MAEDTGLNQQVDPAEQLIKLKQRADVMGIEYSNNIGLETLAAKIDAKLASKPEPETVPAEPAQVNALEVGAQKTNAEAAALQPEIKERPMTLREQLIAECMPLVRLRITNLDPKKKDLPGEILTVANEYIGTVSKFIPFGEHTDEGYHVPKILYEMLKARKFLSIRTVRDKDSRQIRVESRYVPEFALEVLEPLTSEELAELGKAQLAAGSIGNGL